MLKALRMIQLSMTQRLNRWWLLGVVMVLSGGAVQSARAEGEDTVQCDGAHSRWNLLKNNSVLEITLVSEVNAKIWDAKLCIEGPGKPPGAANCRDAKSWRKDDTWFVAVGDGNNQLVVWGKDGANSPGGVLDAMCPPNVKGRGAVWANSRYAATFKVR